jgi:hypothetical protein
LQTAPWFHQSSGRSMVLNGNPIPGAIWITMFLLKMECTRSWP